MSPARKLVLIVMGFALLVLQVALVWKPFGFAGVSYQSGTKDGKAAGQIVRNFHLTQTVPANLYKTSTQKKLSVHWHNPTSLGPWTTPNCFALRFASYNRANRGTIVVNWHQGKATQSWRVPAGKLENAYRNFCPKRRLISTEPFQVSITGVDSVRGHAATVWLSRSEMPPAMVNGKTLGDRSLVFRLTFGRHVGPAALAGIGHGAFLLGCLLTLGISLLALLAIRRESF